MMLNGARLKCCLLGEARVLQELSVPYRQGVECEGQPTRRAGMLGTGTYGRLQKLGPRMQTGWGPGLELGLPACPATNLKLPSAGWLEEHRPLNSQLPVGTYVPFRVWLSVQSVGLDGQDESATALWMQRSWR